MMPNCFPVLEITRTSLAVICSLVLGPVFFFALKFTAKTINLSELSY